MRVLIRIIAVGAALSVLTTIGFVGTFVAGGGIRPLLATGLLGGMTLVGWVVTFVAGPITAVQLWRFRASGRRAGIVLFGYGLVYYVVGLAALRSPNASVWQILAAAAFFSIPLLVLFAPQTRRLLSGRAA